MLKFIIFFILFLFALLFFILFLVLFCNFFFEIKTDKDSDAVVHVKVTWLFHILRLLIDYEDKKTVITFTVFGLKPKKRNKNTKKKEIIKKKSVKENIDDNTTEKISKDETSEVKTDDSINNSINETPKKIKGDEKEKTGKKRAKKKRNKNEGSSDNRGNTFEQIKKIINYPDKKVIIQKTTLLIKRLFRSVKMRSFDVSGEVGFESPHITGYLIALESVIVSMFGLPVTIKGNFNEKVMKIRLNTKGKVKIFNLMWPVAAYIFSKPIRKIVWAYLKEDKNE